jgi:hypothetical protein
LNSRWTEHEPKGIQCNDKTRIRNPSKPDHFVRQYQIVDGSLHIPTEISSNQGHSTIGVIPGSADQPASLRLLSPDDGTMRGVSGLTGAEVGRYVARGFCQAREEDRRMIHVVRGSE